MNEILKNLASLSDDTLHEAEGVDSLYLNAVHLRAFLYTLESAGTEEFTNSFLYQALLVGATYSIILKITKLYDRKKDFKVNSLRELWKQVKGTDEEASKIANEFDTKNENSLFKPLIDFRDKTLAHNEIKMSITWEQIDKALRLLTRVWHVVGEHSNSFMLFPFYEFKQVSRELDKLFSKEQMNSAEQKWNEYISGIKAARINQ